uniref:Uncharacterized protein n=1 Tax=Rhizophora mucronata TaxID=61149 RepID=A0A2P2NC20_RHIMU
MLFQQSCNICLYNSSKPND